MIQRLGIQGAAMARAIRAWLELVVMLFFARRFAPVIGKYALRWLVAGAVALGMLLGIVYCGSFLWRLLGMAAGMLIWTPFVWFFCSVRKIAAKCGESSISIPARDACSQYFAQRAGEVLVILIARRSYSCDNVRPTDLAGEAT